MRRRSNEDTEMEERYRARTAKNNDARGKEVVLDPVPMAPPLGYTRSKSVEERMRDMIRGEHLRLYALAQGNETFEEADDFDVGDDEDYDPDSPYEDKFDPVDHAIRNELRNAEFRAQYEERMSRLQGALDATANRDQRRGENTERRDRGRDQERESDPESIEKPDDGRGNRKVDKRVAKSERKD